MGLQNFYTNFESELIRGQKRGIGL